MKIYTKIKDEYLTPAEASEAQALFPLPYNGTFLHWSSSLSEDIKVEELTAGGTGIQVTSDLIFYPSVRVSSLTSELHTSTYGNNQTLISWQKVYNIMSNKRVIDNSSDFNYYTKPSDGFELMLACYVWLDLAIGVDDQYKNPDYKYNFSDYVSFGYTQLNNLPVKTHKVLVAQSEYTGKKYYLKVSNNEENHPDSAVFAIRAYEEENGIAKQLGDSLGNTNTTIQKKWSILSRYYNASKEPIITDNMINDQ